MDRIVAASVISATLALDGPLGEVDLAVSKIANEQERAIFVEALGNILRILNDGFILPISKEYPDLMPDDA